MKSVDLIHRWRQISIFIKISLALLILLVLSTNVAYPEDTCVPGWYGTVLSDCDSLTNWSVEYDSRSNGAPPSLVPPIIGGQAIRLDWNMPLGPFDEEHLPYVQAKYTFPQPMDLSGADIFGISLQGGGPSEHPNTIAIMFADTSDVFYGYAMNPETNCCLYYHFKT